LIFHPKWCHVGLASTCHFLVLDPHPKGVGPIYGSYPIGLLYFIGPGSLDHCLKFSPAGGVNQQPPMHQFRMRPLKPFSRWTKNTSSLPKIINFFQPLLYPKIFPYLPPTSFPPTSPLLPPSWFCTHSITITRAQELLEHEHKQHEQS
jgi:hypothetical protein